MAIPRKAPSCLRLRGSTVLQACPEPVEGEHGLAGEEQHSPVKWFEVPVASYAYTDAKITKDNDFFVGNRLNNVPKNTASLWTTYVIPKGSLQGLGFGFGLFYVGEREGDLNNPFQVPDYLRTDAALYYRRENLNLALNVKNLFDIDYIESAGDELSVAPADPLTVELLVKYEF